MSDEVVERFPVKESAQEVLRAAVASAGAQAMIALATGLGPAGAAVVSVGTFAQGVMPLIYDEFRERGRQIDAMSEAAVEAVGDVDTLLAHARRSDQSRRAVVGAIEAAASSSFAPGLGAIGRVLAEGLMSDDDTVLDTSQQVIDALRAIQRPHVTVMWALRAPLDVPAGDGGEKWLTPELTWFELREKLPESYRSALDRVLATLEREGLIRSAHAPLPNSRHQPLKPEIRERTSDYFALTDFGLRALSMLRGAGASDG